MHQLTHFLQRRRAATRFAIASLSIVIVVILLRLSLSLLPSPQPLVPASFKPLETIPVKAQKVAVGFYPVNIYGLDISSNTYYVDTYVWFRWKGNIDPLTDLEFVNAVDDWGMTQKPGYEKPQQLADGSRYQIVRVEGRFVQPFVLTRFPLDHQRLSITIENSIYTADQLVYLPDPKDSGFADTVSVQGWRINGWRLQPFLHDYPSQFGWDGNGTPPYSAIRYDLLVSRPLNYFIWKLLLPLIIVLFASWGALLLNPSYVESRIAIPVTALLTIVFLQQSYSDALPEVGYLVLLDKIYALAYLLVIAAIMEAIITADWVKHGKPENHIRVRRLDRPFLFIQLVLLIGGVGGLIWLT